MDLTILIVQKLDEKYSNISADYEVILNFLGYETAVCHDADKLSKMMKAFNPNLVIWIYPSSEDISDILRQHRQENEKLKVIWAFEEYGRIAGNPRDYYDDVFLGVVFTFSQLKKKIIKHFGDSYVTDKLNEYALDEEQE